MNVIDLIAVVSFTVTVFGLGYMMGKKKIAAKSGKLYGYNLLAI